MTDVPPNLGGFVRNFQAGNSRQQQLGIGEEEIRQLALAILAQRGQQAGQPAQLPTQAQNPLVPPRSYYRQDGAGNPLGLPSGPGGDLPGVSGVDIGLNNPFDRLRTGASAVGGAIADGARVVGEFYGALPGQLANAGSQPTLNRPEQRFGNPNAQGAPIEYGPRQVGPYYSPGPEVGNPYQGQGDGAANPYPGQGAGAGNPYAGQGAGAANLPGSSGDTGRGQDTGSGAGLAAGRIGSENAEAQRAEALAEYEARIAGIEAEAAGGGPGFDPFPDLANALARRQGELQGAYEARADAILNDVGLATRSGGSDFTARQERSAAVFGDLGSPRNTGRVARAGAGARDNARIGQGLLADLEEINSNYYRERAGGLALLEEAFRQTGNNTEAARAQAELDAAEASSKELEDLNRFGFDPREHTEQALIRWSALTETTSIDAALIFDGIRTTYQGGNLDDYKRLLQTATEANLTYQGNPIYPDAGFDSSRVFTDSEIDRIVSQVQKFLALDEFGRPSGFFANEWANPAELERLLNYETGYDITGS